LFLRFGLGNADAVLLPVSITSGMLSQLPFREQFAAGNGLVFNAGDAIIHHRSSFLLGLGACTAWACRSWRALRAPCLTSFHSFDVEHFRRTGCLRTPCFKSSPWPLFSLPFLFWYSVSGWRRLCI